MIDVDSTYAKAFPGLPLIFAEGFQEDGRKSMHDHASLAITSCDGNVCSVTSVSRAGEYSFMLDGHEVAGDRIQGVRDIADRLLQLAGIEGSLDIVAENRGIHSGSSDSGAAALVTAIDGLLGLGLTENQLVAHSMPASETSYRSIYGGLSMYRLSDGAVATSQLTDSSFFDDVRIFVCPFDIPRFSADVLHKAVVAHPSYGGRSREAREKVARLEAMVADDDLVGVLGLMEGDARRVHGMFDDLGYNVIKPEMRRVTEIAVKSRDDGLKAYWNVAGGSVVYVFTLREYAEDMAGLLTDANIPSQEYRVAGPARII
ncbi:hypothetical protein ACFLRF_03790 [Candidatus Altiarchaeota archaeon]